MSSSAIGFQTINKGPTGATGARGAQGPIGPTGGLGGPTGSTGNVAPYILNVSLTGQTATVELSDGTEYLVSGNFLGATGSDTTIISIKDPLNPDSDSTTYSLLASGNNTNSFVMRGISGFGSLVVTENASTIFIDSIYTPSSGSLDSFGLTNNTLVYLKQRDQISSTTIGITSGNFYDGVLNFEKSGSTPASPSFSKLLPRSKVNYLTPTYKTSTPQPIVLNVDDAGVFYVRTPNGISAFNGNFKSSEVVSFTLITESDDIWNFPSNVYFENGENYLTCGKSILNLTSFDQGTSWYATVAARGIDASVTNCQIRGVLGSCCYTGVTGSQCVDYVTKNQCDILSGTFNPLQPCETACGYTFGICCSNGQCIEDANYAECLAFGGRFLFGVTCGSFGASLDPNATNATRLCYDSCQNQKVACCKDGVCLGDEFTKIECENILGGVAFVEQPCSSVDCCEQNVKIGACCKNQECSQKTLNECKAIGGVFMGEGELCENVNCKCIGDPPYGACCKCINGVRECSITLQENCVGGIWTYESSVDQNSSCNDLNPLYCLTILPNCSPNQENGKCCYCETGKQATVCEFLPRNVCVDLDGNFTIGADCSTPCDPCTSNDGGPCVDCAVAVPGVCCNCSDSNQPCIPIDDVKNCPPEYTENIKSTVCANNPCGCSTSSSDCDLRTESPQTSCPPLPASFDVLTGNVINSTTSTQRNIITKAITDTSSNTFKPMGGVLVKDFYIDINGSGFQKLNNGKDLKFCLTLDLKNFGNPSTPLGDNDDSVRVYILRTWYPKFFAQNYANYKNFHYSGSDDNFDQSSTVITEVPAKTDFQESSETENGSYWGYLAELDPEKTGGSQFTEADVLSGYINKNQQYSIKHYTDPYFALASYNTDDLRMELNCPLFGLNTRGKAVNESDLIPSGFNSFSPIKNILNNNANSQNIYPNPEEVDSTGYYDSVDIGIKYTSNSLQQLPENMQYPKIYPRIVGYLNNDNDGLTYNSTSGIARSNYLLFNKSAINLYNFSTSNGNNYSIYRFAGYNDIGIAQQISPTENKFNNITDIGYYTNQAILTNFANLGGKFDIASNIKTKNVGHPITMDYDGDFYVEGFPGSQSRRIRYQDPDKAESPIKYTKNSAIIFDSGVITRRGNTLKTLYFGARENPGSNIIQTFTTDILEPHGTRIYTGAINNPANVDNGRKNAKTVSKFLIGEQNPLNAYNFCITLPNYKDYIFDSTNIENEALIDNLQTAGRFTNFENKIRVVVFSYAHEPSTINKPIDNVKLMVENDDPDTLISYAQNYIDNIQSQQVPNSVANYSISFNDPNRCVNQDNQCELCSGYINNDYESNCYSIFSALVNWNPTRQSCRRYCNLTTFDPTTGLGSTEGRCYSTGTCDHNMALVCSCGDESSCSCKGESLMYPSIRPGCFEIPECTVEQSRSCSRRYAGSSSFNDNSYPSWPLEMREDLTNRGFVYYNFPLNSGEEADPVYTSGFVVKVKPITLDGKQFYTDGFNVFNKNTLCNGPTPGGGDCAVPLTDKRTSTIYHAQFCGSPGSWSGSWSGEGYTLEQGVDTTSGIVWFGRSSNKCIFSNKSCNFGSDDEQTDLQTVKEKILTDLSLFTRRTYEHENGPPCTIETADYLNNYQEVLQGTCPPSSFTDTFINKLIPIEGSEPLCIPLECSVNDCSQYEDCSPT
jgi:hypothetical protein